MKPVLKPDKSVLDYIEQNMNLDGSSVVWSNDIGKHKEGLRCGTINSHGYVVVSVLGKKITAHRIAYYLANGYWAEKMLDHIDGDKTNNSSENLRQVDSLQNAQNKRANHGSFRQGVYKKNGTTRKKPFKAQIYLKGKCNFLGYYATEKEAHSAYVQASIKFFGEYSPYVAQGENA